MSQNPLEPLDVADINGVAEWHIRFSQYVKTNDKIDSTNETAFYITYVGKQAFRLLVDLAYPNDVTAMPVKDLQALLQKHLTPPNIEVVEREKFHNLVKKPEETYKNFALRVQRQAAKCSFGADLTTQLRDRLVAGVRDPDLKRKLCKEHLLDYAKAKSIVEEWDAVQNAVTPVVVEPLYVANKYQNNKPHLRSRQAAFPKSTFKSDHASTTSRPFNVHSGQSRFKSGKCDSCGGAHQRSTCKFRKAKCHACSKEGHIARVCRSTKPSVNVKAVEATASDSDEIFVFTVGSGPHLYQQVQFTNGMTSQFIVDTGSPITFMSNSEYLRLHLQPLHSTTTTIKGVSGHQLPVIGKVHAMINKGNTTATLPIYVTNVGPTVLGLDGLRALNIQIALSTQATNVQMPLKNRIKELIYQASQNKGGMKIEPVSLDYVGDPKFLKSRPMSYGLRGPVEENIKNMVNDGILSPVHSSAWATPIVTPIKSNGEPRICGDYRITINKQLRQTAVVTPPVDDMFQGLSGQVFSKVDLSHAFLQIPLNEQAKELTTINTPWGLYQFNNLPFGLNVSPGIFQREINKIIQNLPGTRAYQDDIIVFADNRDEHDQRLIRLLEVLNNSNVLINAKKSEFAVSKLKYLGYILDETGITADTDRILAVKNAPKPDTTDKLKSFLGFAQFYSKFVPNFADLVRPLYDFLQVSSNNLKWTSQTNASYNQVLHHLLHGKVLGSFKLGMPTELFVDASEYAIGAILQQQDRPITCISRKLTPSELNYSQTQKEALAIHWAVARLHKYLYAQPFTIVTDHQALQYIFNRDHALGKVTSRMLQRWALDLSGYDFAIKHKPGKLIPHADYLSRHSKFETIPAEPTEIAFTEYLPISRNQLIAETKIVFGPVIAGLRQGWSMSAKKRFPELHSKREHLSTTADGVIMFHDLPLIPPIHRHQMLQYLHTSHFGRDKMISLARMVCWWPKINTDIASYIASCEACTKKPRTHNSLIPWPLPFKPLQRIHVDFCGPFLSQYEALVIIDAYSKWPEVFLTKTANADFVQMTLQKFFAREGIAQTIVSDNGTPFVAQSLQTWLRRIGCTPMQTAPRHPQSNGLAENFVRTLKTAIQSRNPTTFVELNKTIDTFLLQYRNTKHLTSGKIPAEVFRGRLLRMNAMDTTAIQFFRGNEQRISEGLVLDRIGSRMFSILDCSDNTVHRRHRDQITISSSTQHEQFSSLVPNNSSPSPSPHNTDTTEPMVPLSPLSPCSPAVPPVPPAVGTGLEQTEQPCFPSPSRSPVLRRSGRSRKKPDRYGDFV